MAQQLMAGKRGLIMGLANDKSIAWGIAKACAGAGADLAFSYQGDALKKRVDPLAAEATLEALARSGEGPLRRVEDLAPPASPAPGEYPGAAEARTTDTPDTF